MKLSKGQVFGVVVMILVGIGGLGWCVAQAPVGALKVIGLVFAILLVFFVVCWLMIVARRRPPGSGLAQVLWRLLRGLDDLLKLSGAASGATVGDVTPPPRKPRRK